MADTDQKLARLKVLTGESDEELLSVLLSAAEAHVRNRLYPFDSEATDIPVVYEKNILEIAVYLYNRRGSEGETVHDEGDVRRAYASAGIPADLLKGIMPFCGVL